MDRNYCFPELKKLETDRLRENVHKEGTSMFKELHVVYTVHVHTCIYMYIDAETVNRTYMYMYLHNEISTTYKCT